MTRLRVLLMEDNEDDVAIILRELRRAGYDAVAERVANADGAYRWILARDICQCDAAGKPYRMSGADTDLTERRRMEEALQEAQASLQLATESAKVAVWKCNLRSLTIRFSAGWERVLGRDAGELTLTALWDLVHPDDRARTTKAMQEHLQGRTAAYENEQRMLHVDGSYRWVLSRGVVTRDAKGRPSQWFGADIDVTERKTLEESLRRSEEQYRHLVEDITDVIYTADCDGRVSYMSPAAERLYGYAPAEVINRPFSEFIFPEDLPGVIEGFQEAMSGSPQPHDHRVVTKVGDVRWVQDHTRPILQGGQIVGLQGILSDVTERKRAEDTLRALTATLEQQVAERTRALVAVNERLGLITDNMLDMLSQVNLDGIFQYVSPAHEQVLGYPPQQMLGKSVFDFLHPDDVGGVTAVIEATLHGASIGRLEFRYRHADGHYIWLETVGKLLFDDHGTPVGAVLNGRDVTERRRVEESLRESEERFSSAFEFAAIGKALVAPDGRWLKVNRALCELVGYREEELLQKTFQDITHPDDLEADLAYVHQMLAGEIRTYQMEKRYFHKSGEVLWVLLSVSLVRDSKGHPLYFISQIQDIGARKRAEADIRHLNAELEQRVLQRTAQLDAANQDLEAFSYSVSHDLRTPLRHIAGFSNMLLEDNAEQLNDSGRHCLDRIQADCQRMGQLIDDLLALSHVSCRPLCRERVDLSALARSVAAELQAANPERTVDAAFADGAIALGDPSLLRIVLENLLGNAWKYTSKHPTARIEFGLRYAECGVRPNQFASSDPVNPQSAIHGPQSAFFVRDDGAGFDSALSDKLFAPFQRLHSAAAFEGTGIGLAIVARIIRRHGGQVWAEGAVGQGATFYFTLGDDESVDTL
ncbi:MAG: PAS domain S-box protein [Deltaproteobacteria bacterium]|nr:PAS domain S-box protein [Deltaproteobacteria bacterium]